MIAIIDGEFPTAFTVDGIEYFYSHDVPGPTITPTRVYLSANVLVRQQEHARIVKLISDEVDRCRALATSTLHGTSFIEAGAASQAARQLRVRADSLQDAIAMIRLLKPELIGLEFHSLPTPDGRIALVRQPGGLWYYFDEGGVPHGLVGEAEDELVNAWYASRTSQAAPEDPRDVVRDWLLSAGVRPQ